MITKVDDITPPIIVQEKKKLRPVANYKSFVFHQDVAQIIEAIAKTYLSSNASYIFPPATLMSYKFGIPIQSAILAFNRVG